MEINRTFANFFQSLYSSEATGDTSHQTTLLDNIQIPGLSDEAREQLDSSLSVFDIFKAFKEKLVQPLLNMFEESLENGILTRSLRKAVITLIPKTDKPQTTCELYRPISFINTDAKILARF